MSKQTRNEINEVLKTDIQMNGFTMNEIISMIYTVYKDIEKIKKHLGIEDKREKIKVNTLQFEYKNWKNQIGIRTVIPKEIWYGSTEFHSEEQWFLKAIDVDKLENRDFAIQDIIKFL